MIGNFQAGEVMEVLGLPEEIRPLLIVAFGKSGGGDSSGGCAGGWKYELLPG